jgi:hypothetical protein
MSSPLHNVIIHFDFLPDFTLPALASSMEKILKAYYDCQGLDYPRKVDSLTISLHPRKPQLVFDSRSRSTPASNLKLQFGTIKDFGLTWDKAVEETFSLFPSNDVQEFTIGGLPLTRRMLQKMKGLSRLELHNQHSQDIRQALDALSLDDRGMSTGSTTSDNIESHMNR